MRKFLELSKRLKGNSSTTEESSELSEVQPTPSSRARCESTHKVDSTNILGIEHSGLKLDYDSCRHFQNQGRDLIEPTNEFIDDAIQILNNYHWKNAKDFLKPWGWQKVTLVHLAAYRGKIDMLERAVSLYSSRDSTIEPNEANVDPLLATDKLGRCALHYAASVGHSNVVGWILGQVDPKSSTHPQLSLEDVFGRTPLHDAVGNLHADVVELLINAGAAVNVPNRKGVPPYLPAASDQVVQKANDFELHPDDLLRYEKIVQIFIKKKVDVNFQHPINGRTDGWTMLYYAVYLGSHVATKQLLENGALQRLPSIVRPKIEEFVLVFAVRFYRNTECIRVLVDHGGNLAKATPALGRDTVFEELTTYLDDQEAVSFLTELLDERTRLIKDEKDSVILDYQVLLPPDEPQMAVVSVFMKAMTRKELQTTLQHPLLQAFIRDKWLPISKLFYSFLVLYAVFVISLSGYTIELVYKKYDRKELRYVILVFAAIFLFFNLQQLSAEPIRRVLSLGWHIRHSENWLMFILLTLSMAVAIAGDFIPNVSTRWISQSLSVAAPLSWIQVVLLLGRIPASDLLDVRYYALLFSIVLKHVFKVLCIGFFVIVGFSFSFFILFQENEKFNHPLEALAKTVVMMMGEFDYSDLFNGTSASDSENGMNMMFHTIISKVLFVLFVIVINIVFMNLTIGLVINDIQALEKEGQCARLAQRVKFIADFERISKYLGSRGWVPKCLKNWLKKSTVISDKVTICEDAQLALWKDFCTVFQRKDRRQKSRFLKSRWGH